MSVPTPSVGTGTGSGDVSSAAEGRLVVGTPGLVLSVQLGTARALVVNWGCVAVVLGSVQYRAWLPVIMSYFRPRRGAVPVPI